MIYAKKKDLARYLGINHNLDTLIHYILEQDYSRFVLGKNGIDGDLAFANRFEYDTIPEDDGFFEGHRAYGDVHVMVSGEEKIGISNTAGLAVSGGDEASDFIKYEGTVECWCPMTTEDILVAFPEDAHMVKIQNGTASRVQKICFKFKV